MASGASRVWPLSEWNAKVIHDGEAQGTHVQTKEVGALARHLEGEWCEDHGAVTHSEGGSAHNANLSAIVTVRVLHTILDRHLRKKLVDHGPIEDGELGSWGYCLCQRNGTSGGQTQTTSYDVN